MALLAAGAAALALAGCAGTPQRAVTPGELALTATWRDAQHMDVTVKNVGGSSMPLSGMDAMQLTAPNGTRMPIHWSGAAPTLAPGESRAFDLHAMRMADGTMGMAMDHTMAGDHVPMPMGDYVLHMGNATAAAMLGG